MSESKILYEVGRFWVCKAAKGKGFEVYQTGVTHSRRCAIIGYEGDKGIARAIDEANRRHAEASQHRSETFEAYCLMRRTAPAELSSDEDREQRENRKIPR